MIGRALLRVALAIGAAIALVVAIELAVTAWRGFVWVAAP